MTALPDTPPSPKRSFKAALYAGLAFVVVTFLVALAHVGLALHRTWESMREGGWGLWVILALMIFMTPAVLGYGLAVSRRARWPGWPLLLPALLPPLVAAAVAALAMRMVREAISSASVHPSQKATLQAAGTSEALNLTIFGAWTACLLLSLAALLLGGRALGRVGPGVSVGRGLALGGGAFVLALAAGAVAVVLDAPILTAGLLAAVFAAGAAAMGVAALAAPEVAEAPDGHALALSDTLGAVFTSGAAIALGGLAARASGYSLVFGAVAAKSVDPSQKVAILAQGYAEVGAVPWATLAFALPLLALAAVAIISRAREVGKAFGRAWAVLLVAIFVAVVPEAALGLQTAGLLPEFAKLTSPETPADVTLPVADRVARLDGAGGTPLYLGREELRTDSRTIGKSSLLDHDDGCDRVASKVSGAYRLVVAADGSTPYRRMACLVRALRRAAEADRGGSRHDDDSSAKPGVVRWMVQHAGRSRPLPEPFDDLPPPRSAVSSRTFLASDVAGVGGAKRVWARLSKGGAIAVAGAGSSAGVTIRSPLEESARLHLWVDPDVPATEVLNVLGAYSSRDGSPPIIGAFHGPPGNRKLDVTDRKWLELGAAAFGAD